MLTPSAPNKLAMRLGFAGLSPFVLLAFLLWIAWPDLRPWLTIALTSYAALIATFLGGIHWGIAGGLPDPSTSRQRNFHLIWGITPSLVAWLALIMPAYAGLPVIAALLMVCYFIDCKSYVKVGWSAWLPMRLKLTVVAVLSCLIGAGAI